VEKKDEIARNIYGDCVNFATFWK